MSYTVNAVNANWTPGPTGVKATQSLALAVTGSVAFAPAAYAEVEGPYPTDNYPQNHIFDPGIIGPGLRFLILAVAAGATPPNLASGSRANAFVPRWTINADKVTRQWTAYPSDFYNGAKVAGPWDVYFGFADTAYGDNNGAFTVTTAITDIDQQMPGQIIALPGHITQDDIDTAFMCSVLGVLTPGNRGRFVDGRMMCDLVAPFKREGPKEYI